MEWGRQERHLPQRNDLFRFDDNTQVAMFRYHCLSSVIRLVGYRRSSLRHLIPGKINEQQMEPRRPRFSWQRRSASADGCGLMRIQLQPTAASITSTNIQHRSESDGTLIISVAIETNSLNAAQWFVKMLMRMMIFKISPRFHTLLNFCCSKIKKKLNE